MACRTGQRPGICGGITGCSSPSPRCRTGWRPGGKKAEAYVAADYLDEALADFSGYIAADELYDGPFCVLSIVDNRAFKRLVYDVLDHDPAHEDILRFFRRFQHALEARGLAVKGITTDGSPLYPAPVLEVFGPIAHQVCEFHVVAELTKAVLGGVAKVRKTLKARLFGHRHLFVKHRLTQADKRILARVSTGQRHLRSLRQVMDEVYRLFDRRCRTDTALRKLATLRQRVRRFTSIGKTLQKLFSPTLERALTFLDDSLLPSTSNAVERGNRRHRKMQKTVYRVRTQEHIEGRIAMDMHRDAQAEGRTQTLGLLHQVRAGLP